VSVSFFGAFEAVFWYTSVLQNSTGNVVFGKVRREYSDFFLLYFLVEFLLEKQLLELCAFWFGSDTFFCIAGKKVVGERKLGVSSFSATAWNPLE